ncbi:hypothetical protein CK203_115255 [Vitis vinifera]|uniref:Retrotransposon gag domain-containing protein n=2 Tax=Vitis vinifera TaxID=29760 RepID=A0A438CBG1_VITVI|nr:hypothetical protein CK203_115255 [Vitis vinifera]
MKINTLSINNENPTLQIATSKLKGRNFMERSRSVKISLKSKGKVKYVMGTAKPPAEDGLEYEVWDAEDSMVMSWLPHSMQPEISKTYLFLTTAEDIWEAVSKTYSKVGVSSQIIEVKRHIFNTKQGSSTVTEYYNALKGLWPKTRFIPEPGDGISH